MKFNLKFDPCGVTVFDSKLVLPHFMQVDDRAIMHLLLAWIVGFTFQVD